MFATEFVKAAPTAPTAPAAASPPLTRRALLPLVHAFLQETATANDASPSAPRAPAFAHTAAMRTLPECLSLIEQHNVCSETALLVGLEYLRRVSAHVVPTTANLAPLYLTAVMTAHKFLQDIPYDNRTFSHILRCSVQDINRMELDFLALITFTLSVDQQTISSIESFLKSRSALSAAIPSATATPVALEAVV